MIMLITALLISGSASAILISQWSGAFNIAQQQNRALIGPEKVSVALSGDPSMTSYNTTANSITVYLVNLGLYDLNSTTYEVFIDGAPPTSTSTNIIPSSSDWQTGYLLELTMTDSGWTYNDGDDISITFVGVTERYNGQTYFALAAGEVRLHVI